MIKRLWVQSLAGVVGKLSSSDLTFCADSYFSIHSTQCYFRSQTFCQKCRWQVTAKHAYTLSAWTCTSKQSSWSLHGTQEKRSISLLGFGFENVPTVPVYRCHNSKGENALPYSWALNLCEKLTENRTHFFVLHAHWTYLAPLQHCPLCLLLQMPCLALWSTSPCRWMSASAQHFLATKVWWQENFLSASFCFIVSSICQCAHRCVFEKWVGSLLVTVWL